METYVAVMFWLSVITLVCRGIVLSLSSYPRKPEVRLGSDLVGFMSNAGFMVWAGILLFA